MESWKEQNPYLRGINWYSNLEVNIRLINWYWCWILLEKDELWQKPSEIQSFPRRSMAAADLYAHCVYSERNPSQYSSANNRLIAEYAGLFIASTLWKFRESAGWLKKSRRGLEREIVRQHSEQASTVKKRRAAFQFITDFSALIYCRRARRYRVFVAVCAVAQNYLQLYQQPADMNGNIPKYGDGTMGE